MTPRVTSTSQDTVADELTPRTTAHPSDFHLTDFQRVLKQTWKKRVLNTSQDPTNTTRPPAPPRLSWMERGWSRHQEPR